MFTGKNHQDKTLATYLFVTLIHNLVTDIAPHSQMFSFVMAHQLRNLWSIFKKNVGIL